MKRVFICIIVVVFIVGGLVFANFTEPEAQSNAQSVPASSTPAASEPASTEPASSEAAAPSESAAPSEVSRAQTSIVDFFIEGETESVPSTLYVGNGYSLYVPDEGWTVSASEDRVTWISTDNETVGFSVTVVPNASASSARAAYIADSGFEFEDLNGGEFGDPLLGWDEDGDALGIMSAEKNGTVYILAWTFPEEAAEGFGARLQQIADTFEVM